MFTFLAEFCFAKNSLAAIARKHLRQVGLGGMVVASNNRTENRGFESRVVKYFLRHQNMHI
jgi:hypothetical protein